MSDKINSNNITTNLEEGKSRLFDDNFNNVEDKNSDFQNNLISFYEKQVTQEQEAEKQEEQTINQEIPVEEKQTKEEIKDEVTNKIISIVKTFFNNEKVVDGNEFKNRCINASKITIVMLLLCFLSFLNFRLSNGLDIFLNVICLIVFGYGFYMLKQGTKTGIYLGLAGGLLCVISFDIIKIIFGVAYIYGLLLILKDNTE